MLHETLYQLPEIRPNGFRYGPLEQRPRYRPAKWSGEDTVRATSWRDGFAGALVVAGLGPLLIALLVIIAVFVDAARS